MLMSRWLQHLLTTRLVLRWRFPASILAAIDQAIAESELRHHAEIRCAIETALPLGFLLRGRSARDRALDVFARLGVWDTEDNNGVLLYILLAEHSIEIVADRGFTGRVSDDEWADLAQALEQDFRAGRFADGTLAVLRDIGGHAARHFPATGDNPNELPNRPVIL